MSCIAPKSIVLRSGETVTIRSARPDDAAPLMAYLAAVLGESPHFVLAPDEAAFTVDQERLWIQQHLDSPGQLALLVEYAGQIVASLSFENGPHRRTAHRGTFGISVRQPWRNRGIGTALLRALLDWAAANPLIEKVGLSVFADNAGAIRLYQRLGFVEEGRRPREMKLAPGQYADDVLMYRFV